MFSVIVPLYNKEKYVKRCVNSILDQSFAKFELIIVDDASTDGSLEIVKNIKDDRIVILERAERGYGGYAARNLGIENAKYDFIAFLDADDEWLPNHLAEIAKLIEQFPDVKVFSSGWYLKSGGTKKTDSYTLNQKFRKGHKVDDFYIESSKGNNPINTIVAVIHKNIFEKAGNFPAGKCKKGGDIELWMRCMLHSGIAHTGKITAIYYKDIQGTVTRKISDFETPYVVKSAGQIMKMLAPPESVKIKKYANKYAKIAILRSIIFNKNKKKVFKGFFKDVDKNYYYFFKLLMIFPPFVLKPLFGFYRFLMLKFSKSDLG